ncbi:MAG: protein kinase [Acidobacteria bacterium]|nr:protein kinase [Acidobacteriota bacterium]
MEPQVLGKYRLEKIVGRGAMGVIYEAFDTTLHRKVAIKTMTGELTNDPNLRKRFYLEARAAANLHHSNIITIHDMGEEGHAPYIVMELLEGTDLKSLLQQEKNWPFARIAQIGIQTANGLSYAHQANIVHRDIKPANIFVSKNETVKILDFGVAHVISSTLTQAGMLLGSIGYMAPEQITGQKVDGRADQYSLGVILYELVTGVKPFIEKDITATIQAIMKMPPVPPRNIREDCPADLERIILKCLNKDRDNRFPDMSFVAKGLELVLSNTPTAESRTPAAKPGPSLGEISTPGGARPSTEQRISDTRQWLSIQELLAQSKAKAQAGEVQEAFTLLKEHYRLYQKDPEFQTFFRQLKVEKESFDKKSMLQKHYHDAVKLLEEDNFKLARLEMETLLKIDPSSILISQLEQEISRRETYAQIQDWVEEAEKSLTSGQWAPFIDHVQEGRKRFERVEEFRLKLEQLVARVSEAFQAAIKQAVRTNDWQGVLTAMGPVVQAFPQEASLREKYEFCEQKAQRQQQISRLQEWMDRGEKLLQKNAREEIDKHIGAGDAEFRDLKEYQTCRKNLQTKQEKLETDRLLQQIQPLEKQALWEEAVDILRPYLRQYAENRPLVEKYNLLMKNKLEKERLMALQQFVDDQVKIVETLIKSQQYEQAKKYIIVLLDKYPGTPEFEDSLIRIENHLTFQRSIAEIRQHIVNEDYDQAYDIYAMLRDAYGDEVQLEILQHELENLRMSLDTRNLKANSEARLDNAISLAEKGAYDKALEIIREMMASNPEHTFLYTNYVTIKTEKETREREDLLQGLKEINEIEKKGELYFAIEKARSLSERFPGEDTLTTLQKALRKKYVSSQVERIQKATQQGSLQEAAALLETNLKLLPNEKAFQDLRDNLDMEKKKSEFLEVEIQKVRTAVAERRIDDALEIANSLIPLNPNNAELKEFLKDIVYQKTRML